MLLPLLLLLSANLLVTGAGDPINQTNIDDADDDATTSDDNDVDEPNFTELGGVINETPNYDEICKNVTLKCDDTQYLDNCPSYCVSDLCPTGEGQNKGCAQPDPCPRPACKCRFGYRKATNGTCIPTRRCPPFTCDRPNEEYNPCPPLCPTDSCSQATPTGKCPFPGRIGIVLQCEPACRCKKGYWRNKEGVCVPYNQCSSQCSGANEHIKCVPNCPPQKTCRNRKVAVNCLDVLRECSNKCVCEENFYRNSKNECVPVEDCDDAPVPDPYDINQCSGANEQLKCVQDCPPQKTCRNRDIQYSCLAVVRPCSNQCVCNGDLVRNSKNECVRVEDCDENAAIPYKY